MEIRKADKQDLNEIQRIYAQAREFQKSTGNPRQWAGGYPQEEIILEDIEKGRLYVCTQDERIGGVFMFSCEEEPTYRRICQGSWPDELPYGVIHRIAGDGSIRGMAAECFRWCRQFQDRLRIDTHEDNRVMQHVLEKNGFVYCGLIYLENGEERQAYQYTA
ncbi:MAG: GNAT family N-acetyltransferase [Eubacteriales bacterium]|nr:GNAT family N-acetyltransferase [Eubacteriales bacterium]